MLHPGRAACMIALVVRSVEVRRKEEEMAVVSRPRGFGERCRPSNPGRYGSR